MDPAAAELERARNAILACDYTRAIAACHEALARFPKHVEATCLLAEAYRENGRHEIAEDLLRRVLSADPENVLAHWALGLLLRDRGREEEALAHLRVGHELAPANAELAGDLLSLARDPRAAVAPTRALLGRYHAAAGRFERAADEFRAVLIESPRRLDVWVALAEALWRAGETEEARSTCEAILAEAPHCLKAVIILARLRMLDGEPSAAEELLRLAHQLDPADAMLGRLS